MAFALVQVHAVEAKELYFDNGVSGFGTWFGGGGVNKKGGSWTGAVFDV